MAQLTGLKLRKSACEALGWTIDPETDTWHEPGCEWRNSRACVLDCCDAEDLPEIGEPEFLEWCEKENVLWQLETTIVGGFAVHLRAKPSRIGLLSVNVSGSTPSEARARAIVAGNRRIT